MDTTWTGHSPSPSLPEPQGPCVLPEEGMHPPSPSPGPELITSHPAEEAPCGEVVHLHLGVCVRALLGSLGSLGIWLLQPAPHRHLVAALRALLAPLGDNLVNGDLGWVFPLLAELADIWS